MSLYGSGIRNDSYHRIRPTTATSVAIIFLRQLALLLTFCSGDVFVLVLDVLVLLLLVSSFSGFSCFYLLLGLSVRVMLVVVAVVVVVVVVAVVVVVHLLFFLFFLLSFFFSSSCTSSFHSLFKRLSLKEKTSDAADLLQLSSPVVGRAELPGHATQAGDHTAAEHDQHDEWYQRANEAVADDLVGEHPPRLVDRHLIGGDHRLYPFGLGLVVVVTADRVQRAVGFPVEEQRQATDHRQHGDVTAPISEWTRGEYTHLGTS